MAQAACLLDAGDAQAALAVLQQLAAADIRGYQPYWATLAAVHAARGERDAAAAAVTTALGGRDAVLYDVKCDMQVNSILLGLYTTVCTQVSAKAAKP